jgi:ferritin
MILSANMLTFLSAQFIKEIYNSVAYAQLQSWADMHGFNGAAKFFASQSSDEVGHSKEVLDYIHARNEMVSAPPSSLGPIAIPGYEGLFRFALALEQETTEALYAIKAQADAEGDLMTCAWLMRSGGLILEQVEEENVIQTILDRIDSRGIDPAAAHDIDVWLEGRE